MNTGRRNHYAVVVCGVPHENDYIGWRKAGMMALDDDDDDDGTG
jgi:hypothetical protein